MDELSRKIQQTISRPGYQPVADRELARQLNVAKKGREAFRATLERLLATGKIRRAADGTLRPTSRKGLLEGTIRKTAAGAGFLIVRAGATKSGDPPADVYIPAENLGDSHTGDRVLVELLRGDHRDQRIRGRVVEIVERATRTFVGVYCETDGDGFVQVDGSAFPLPVLVGDPGAKGARPGDKVVFEMVRFPTSFRGGEGVITRVLGARNAPGVDTLSIIHEFGLSDEFPEAVLDDARDQAERFDESQLGDRLDLTEQTIVTIDPVDARDFDDAISLKIIERGHWLLGVHIADVAHFVPVGSALDREAYRRGTSVYLPDRVLPMLPELISNALASLQQGRVRFTRTALIEFNAEGIPIHAEFHRSAIRVTKRFAYEEVMPLLERAVPPPGISTEVFELLGRMLKFSRILRKRRLDAGAIELELPEVKVDIDRQGRVQGAHLVPHDASHQIIEEFMLAANVAVATALADRGVPFLRRVHPDPDIVRLRGLTQFVQALGYNVKRLQSRGDLQSLLARVRDTPHRQAINYALLRSLKQATYSPEELGHYALAAENYCHFTSPIRRYPDLTIHRLLDGLTEGEAGYRKGNRSPDDLRLAGEHCSQTERRAEQAERELIKVKLLVYMNGQIGREFQAVITGVAEYGFFCQLIEVPAEGLVQVSSLDDDFYYFEREAQAIVGRRSGRTHQLGESVRVVVAHVDIDRRKLELRLVGSRAGNAAKKAAASDTPQAESGPKFPRRGKSPGAASLGKLGKKPGGKSSAKKLQKGAKTGPKKKGQRGKS